MKSASVQFLLAKQSEVDAELSRPAVRGAYLLFSLSAVDDPHCSRLCRSRMRTLSLSHGATQRYDHISAASSQQQCSWAGGVGCTGPNINRPKPNAFGRKTEDGPKMRSCRYGARVPWAILCRSGARIPLGTKTRPTVRDGQFRATVPNW